MGLTSTFLTVHMALPATFVSLAMSLPTPAKAVSGEIFAELVIACGAAVADGTAFDHYALNVELGPHWSTRQTVLYTPSQEPDLAPNLVLDFAGSGERSATGLESEQLECRFTYALVPITTQGLEIVDSALTQIVAWMDQGSVLESDDFGRPSQAVICGAAQAAFVTIRPRPENMISIQILPEDETGTCSLSEQE